MPGSEVAIEFDVLGDVSEMLFRLEWELWNLDIIDECGSACWFDEVQEHGNGCTFPCPVRPEDDRDFAVIDFQVQIVNG